MIKSELYRLDQTGATARARAQDTGNSGLGTPSGSLRTIVLPAALVVS
ncbi:MAG TPA: hypothetical protein VN345_14875 [Blastocatellia bacterium]|nr:hypothetical protein [Blastocatellia bacterium]